MSASSREVEWQTTVGSRPPPAHAAGAPTSIRMLRPRLSRTSDVVGTRPGPERLQRTHSGLRQRSRRSPGASRRPDAPTESSTDAKDFRVPGLAAIALAERDEAVVTATPTDVPTDDGRSWLQVLDDRSPDPNVCPFLRATGQSGLIAPIETPDTTNRCAALAEAVPQSLRQQELVCLSTGHVNCPRYLRGAAVMAETPKPVVREGRAMSPAMLGSLVVLVLALSASVGFVLARGGALDIAPPGLAASASPSSVAAASPSAASGAPVVAPTSSSLARLTRSRPRRPPRSPRRRRRQRHRCRRPRRRRARRRSPTAIDCCGPARTRRAAGSTQSEAATTCSASRATSACPRTASTRGTRGCAAAA